MKPEVSVIIPTYNRANLISETVNSVLAQTYHNFEVIVVDDGSTDNTLSVLSGYGNQIRVIRQENQGAGAARNTGIREATGEFVAFLDSDDLWYPYKLERQVEHLKNNPSLLWIYSDAQAFDTQTNSPLFVFSHQSRQYEGDIARRLILKDFIPTTTTLIHRSVITKVGMFIEFPKAQDWDMWLRIAALYPVGRIPEVLARYRIHPGMITQSQNPIYKHQFSEAVINRAVAFAPKVYAPFQKQALAASCVRTGRSLVGQGNLIEARKMFGKALLLNPFSYKAFMFGMATLAGNKVTRKLSQLRKKFRINI